MTMKFFRSPEEVCRAVGVDFDGTLPDRGQNRRLNVSGDPRGIGDANIYVFPDGMVVALPTLRAAKKLIGSPRGHPLFVSQCDKTKAARIMIYS